MKNLITKIWTLLVAIILVGCTEGLPGNIQPRVAPHQSLPTTFDAVKSDLNNKIKTGLTANASIESALNSSNSLANGLGADVSAIVEILEQMAFLTKVPPNAEVSFDGESEVMYDYSLFRIQSGTESNTYITYRILEGEEFYTHEVLSGSGPSPSNRSILAEIPINGGEVTMELDINGENSTLVCSNSSGDAIFDFTSGSERQKFTVGADGSIALETFSNGTLQSSRKWSSAGFGVFDGNLVLEGYETLKMWDDLASLATITGNADVVVAGSINAQVTNKLTSLQPYFDFPGSASVSAGELNGLLATRLSYMVGNSEVTYLYAFDDNARYHQIWMEGSLHYDVSENIDGTSTDMYDYSLPSGDSENTYYHRYRRNVNGDDVRLIVAQPVQWGAPFVHWYADLIYNTSTLAGQYDHRLAPQGQFEAGNSQWNNSHWMVAFWTTNGSTGQYWAKDIFNWGGGLWNGTTATNYQSSGTW